MPRSFASSLLPRSALALVALALSLLAAGCGGTKNVEYSPADVQSAFAAVGVSVYGPRQEAPQEAPDQSRLALAPPPTLRTRPEPLPALLKGIRDAVFVPALRRGQTPVVLRGPALTVRIYPRAEDAQKRVASFADILGAEQILHRITFGYVAKGNVVIDYHVFDSGDRIPGFLGEWDSVETLNQKIKQDVTAALGHLR